MFPKKSKYLVEKLYDHHKEKKRILNIDDEKIGVTIAAANIATAVCKRKRHKQRLQQSTNYGMVGCLLSGMDFK